MDPGFKECAYCLLVLSMKHRVCAAADTSTGDASWLAFAEHADCTKEWSDEENECFEPAAAPNLKAKITKPKAKRKPRTKVSAKMK